RRGRSGRPRSCANSLDVDERGPTEAAIHPVLLALVLEVDVMPIDLALALRVREEERVRLITQDALCLCLALFDTSARRHFVGARRWAVERNRYTALVYPFDRQVIKIARGLGPLLALLGHPGRFLARVGRVNETSDHEKLIHRLFASLGGFAIDGDLHEQG